MDIITDEDLEKFIEASVFKPDENAPVRAYYPVNMKNHKMLDLYELF